MNRTFKLVATILMLLSTALLLGGWSGDASVSSDHPKWIAIEPGRSPGSEAQVVCTEMDDSGMTLLVKVPGLWIESTLAGAQQWDAITLPGQRTTQIIGNPALPAVRFLAAVPRGAKLSWSAKTENEQVIDDVRVIPFQKPLLEDEPAGEFQINEQAYASAARTPVTISSVKETGYWRELRVASIEVIPMQYEPIAKRLTVYSTVEVRVDFKGASADAWPVSASSHMWRSFSSNLVNFDRLGLARADEKTDSGIDYLIIADPDLVSSTGLADLIAFHESEGMTVSLVTTDDTGSTPAEIKNYILTEYQSATPADLDYVLLVGDVDAIPMYDWSANPSDSWYSFLEGDDWWSEIGVGRIPAKDVASLDHVIEKTLIYANRLAKGAWSNRALLVAHKEEYPNKYTACSESIRTYEYTLQPPIFDKVYGGEGGLNINVTNAINEGRNIVNYRGHGSSTTWDSWSSNSFSYSTTLARDLTNGDKTPIVFSIACLNADLESSTETLAEAFLFAEDAAAAFLGATQPSYTDPNHDFDRFLFRAVYDKGILAVSDVLIDANFELATLWEGGSYATSNIQMYLWLGDPALEIDAPGCTPPVVQFTADATKVAPGSDVIFTDKSCGDITAWHWEFGDGDTSDSQNVVHNYPNEGFYTVSLTVTGPDGSFTETKTDYIDVTTCLDPVVDSVSPEEGMVKKTVDLTIEGDRFADGDTTVNLVSDKATIPCTNVVVNSTTELTCSVDLTGQAVGAYDVDVTTTCGTGALTDGFTVNNFFTNFCGMATAGDAPDFVVLLLAAMSFFGVALVRFRSR